MQNLTHFSFYLGCHRSVAFGKNAPADESPGGNTTGNNDNTTNGDGDDFNDNEDSSTGDDDTSGDNSTGGDDGDNCSVVYRMNIGEFQSEMGGKDVHLRIKRLKPTPLIFTPQSLLGLTHWSVTSFSPVAKEFRSVQQAKLAVDVASADVTDAQASVDSTLTAKDAANETLQQGAGAD